MAWPAVRVAAALALTHSAWGQLPTDDSAMVAEMVGAVLTDGQGSEDVKDCLTVPGYPGKCLISASPGACYTLPGDDPPQWQCWVEQQSPYTETDAACRDPTIGNRRGACRFADYGKNVTDKDLPSCFKIPGFQTQCSPLTDKWGACYRANSPEWMCLTKDNPDIKTLRQDCKVSMDSTGAAYDGACVFGHYVQKLYKCDTVPSYDPLLAASNCAGPPQGVAACFSLTVMEAWQCAFNTTDLNPSCDTTQSSVPGKTYDGACLFPQHPDYAKAEDASGLTTTTTTTQPTTTTKLTTTTDGHAHGSGLGAVVALLAAVTAAAQWRA